MNTAKIALEYIVNCCNRIGAYYGTSDVYNYLEQVASDIEKSPTTLVFPDRYTDYVSYAIRMILSDALVSAPSAIASEYLAIRFEYYFRILSGKLNGDGTWLTEQAKKESECILNKRKLGWRLNNVAQAYKLLKHNQSLSVSKYFAELDKKLYQTPTTMLDNTVISNIGDRIHWIRKRVAHGYWGDSSSEGMFFSLLTALIFYSTYKN